MLYNWLYFMYYVLLYILMQYFIMAYSYIVNTNKETSTWELTFDTPSFSCYHYVIYRITQHYFHSQSDNRKVVM